MLTTDSFIQQLRQLTDAKQFCVALSGGLDSTVLLHLFNQLKEQEPDIKLRAVHVHHGISRNADDWVIACQGQCQSYQIPLLVHHLNIKKAVKHSLEELARIKRYTYFQEIIVENEYLVTAHHQDDQAETLLLQLFRGAGPKGLSAMPIKASLGSGFLFRPLLSYQKIDLRNFAEDENLAWIEDDSNHSTQFDRNFLRQDLVPLLKSRWPAIVQNIARSAKHCANATHFIETEVKQHFLTLFDSNNHSLNIAGLLQFEPIIQSYLLRYWLQFLALPLPSTKKLALLQEEILLASGDANPLLCWQQVEIRRFNGHLYAMHRLPPHDARLILPWNITQDLLLPDGKTMLTRNDLQQLGMSLDNLTEVTIRFRQGGERCRLKNRKHSHSLKKLLQEWRVPPWQRERIPLLYVNDQLSAIVGYTACELEL